MANKLFHKSKTDKSSAKDTSTGMTTPPNSWICKKCGATNPNSSLSCKDCGVYK